LDVLAGETVNRTAVAEQLALAPDILLDQPTITALGSAISLSAWRSSEATGERFGVLGAFTGEVAVLPLELLPELGEEVTRPWLNPLVYEREKTGHALLQTDFRPCVALFVRFVGIDYEADTAADQLNQFIRPLQAILAHYEGTFIDLTFGDKGSYAYINFGALSLHEDDARRAAKTALRLLCSGANSSPFWSRCKSASPVG
jgi:class 3 adenylate cyclase